MVNILELDEIHEIAMKILEEAKKQGVDQAQVLVNSTENIATRYGENHITQNTQSNAVGFSLRTQMGNKVGIYSGTAASPQKLPDMIKDAIILNKYSPDDPEFPGFINEQPAYPPLERKIIEYEPNDLAENIKIVVDDAKSHTKIKSVAGSFNYIAQRVVFANTYDVFAKAESSTLTGIVNVAAVVGKNESRSSDASAGITFKDLQVDTVGSKVAMNAIKGLNQQELEVGSYETMLNSEAFMELMFFFGFASSSSMLINHQSPFKDKLGEQLFDSRLTIADTTSDPTHFSSQAFDFEGHPSLDVTYIDKGVVKDFAYNRRNALKLGGDNNGKDVGSFALFRASAVTPGEKSEEELIASIDDGVYVQNLWYANFVDMPKGSITGLTKDGLFRIKNGEIVGSLKNMRFTDDLFSMFGNAEPANNISMKLHSTYGNLFGLSGKVPSIKLDKFNFSSKGKH